MRAYPPGPQLEIAKESRRCAPLGQGYQSNLLSRSKTANVVVNLVEVYRIGFAQAISDMRSQIVGFADASENMPTTR